MMSLNLSCLAISILFNTLPHTQFHPDTSIVADSVQTLLTEDFFARLMLFGKSVESGQEHDSASLKTKGKHYNSLLGVIYPPDTSGRLVPVSIVVGDTTLHFLKIIETNIARAAAHNAIVAAGLKQSGLTAAQVETVLLAIWTANVTLSIMRNDPANIHKPTPDEARTVYWQNVEFVRTHQDQIDKLWLDSGLDVGMGSGLTRAFRGPAW